MRMFPLVANAYRRRKTDGGKNLCDDSSGERACGQVRTCAANDATDVAVRRICPLTLRFLRSARGAYFFSANTQITPPCGTLDSMPILLVASASWMRCASTPHPDWIAMYCVPSIS